MYGSASLSMTVKMLLDGIGTAIITPIFLGQELARGELVLLDLNTDMLSDLHFTATWVDGPEAYACRVIGRIAQQIAAEF
jgi:hypothetical protein